MRYVTAMNHDRSILIERLHNIHASLRYQNNAADSHIIGNLRNTTTLCLDQAENLSDECLEQIITRLESQLVEFFQRKYHIKNNLILP